MDWLILFLSGVIGGVLALVLGQQLMSLYSLPMVPVIYPIMSVIGLLVVTTLAVIVPATKAANISPTMATRSV